LLARRAGDVMTRDPVTISPAALAQEAMALMIRRKITCLFVVDRAAGPAPVGIVHVHDCLRAGLDSV
jgi:arabinose-5-phosphate isomerase